MLIPLSRPYITDKEKAYVLEVLDSGQLSFGDKLQRFENEFNKQIQTKYALAMNSGTSALHVAVKALGLRAGDEVITSPYSFIASSNCLVYEGVKPVFVDIDPLTLNMDVTKIERTITANTKAILAVHVFGQPCDMDVIMHIADKYNLYVIEDACEAIGATWRGKAVGTLGDVGVFAFYPNKQITTGEGGVLITNDHSIFLKANSLRNQGRSVNNEWLQHDMIGYNYRMSDIHAAVGLAQMEQLEFILNKRKEVASSYDELIKQYHIPVTTPIIHPDCEISWFVYVVILPDGTNRNQLMNNLQSNGIQSKPYFPTIHLQKIYRELYSFKSGDFPICEQMSERTLAIPFYTELSLEQQQYVIQHLANELKGTDID